MATAPPPADRRWVVAGLGLVALLGLLAGCSSSSGSAGSSGSSAAPGTRLRVVAAENTWGSIAAQLGGDHAEVVSLITNPDTDPHDYEPTPADARTVAEAQEVIVNGLGYDTWASRLVAADQVEGQHQLDVGHLLGLRTGANPHRWYYPDDVVRVVDQITADYQRLDPADGGEFAARRQAFLGTALAPYHQLLDQIRTRYAGTAVGASESIFAGLAQATGLRLLTPPAYLQAMSEGTDPTPADRATVDAQIAQHRIRVWVLNQQNQTPDVTQLTHQATTAGIPVVDITETLSPAGATFQDWQVAQLRSLSAALARATGGSGS